MRSLFVASLTAEAGDGDRQTVGVEDLDVDIAVARQSGAAVAERADLLEEHLEIERAAGQRLYLIPVLISGQSRTGHRPADRSWDRR